MKDYWLYFKSSLSPQWCKDFRDRAIETYPPQEGTIGFEGTNKVQEDWRKSEIRWMHANKETELVNIVWEHASRANRDSFGFDLQWIYELQFTTYHGSSEKPGKYDPHIDVDWVSNNPYHRKLSVVIQLSNTLEYEGGEFSFAPELPQLPEEAKEQGTIIVFPSFLNHSVSPVTSGTRHSLVSWVEGPRWR